MSESCPYTEVGYYPLTPNVGFYPALVALRLCIVYCDGESSLVSLALNVVLADNVSGPMFGIPSIELNSQLGDGSTHERRAAREGGLENPGDNLGFPGWAVIFTYLDRHPEFLENP